MADASPTDLPGLLAARIGDLLGWWLEVECGCGRSASFPFRWMVEVRNIPADRCLAEVMPKRCSKCGNRPVAFALTDDPAGTASGYGGSDPGKRVSLPVPEG